MYSTNCVILGHSSSLFVRHLATEWLARGMRPVIITFESDPLPLHGVEVISCASRSRIARNGRVRSLVRRTEELVNTGLRSILDTGSAEPYPTAVGPILYAKTLAEASNALQPSFVFAQEAFSYGLAMSLCRAPRRILFPWGGDIYGYAQASAVAYLIAKHSLRNADLIVPSAEVAAKYITERYGIPQEKVRAVSWGVDQQAFHPAKKEVARQLREKFGLPQNAVIAFNVRRFLPLWGCYNVLEAFLSLAKESPGTRFVLIGGASSEPHIAAAKNRIATAGLSDRFLIFDGNVPLSTIAELLSITDIAFSVMKHSDMRSWSVLQAAASGATLVLSNTNAEFMDACSEGFSAEFVDPENVGEIIDAAKRLLQDEQYRAASVEKNLKFIAEKENHQLQMDLLLRLCTGVKH